MKNKIRKNVKYVIWGLPLVSAIGASLLPLSRLSQQFLMLIVLIWIPVFFVTESFLVKE